LKKANVEENASRIKTKTLPGMFFLVKGFKLAIRMTSLKVVNQCKAFFGSIFLR
jgi:hypothetical protein